MIKQQIKFKNSCLKLDVDSIIKIEPKLIIENISDNTKHLKFSYELDHGAFQDDWRIILKPDFIPTFHWAPHLTPTENHVIDQHVFRSPALIVSNPKRVLIIIPDLDILSSSYKTPETHANKKNLADILI